MTDALTDRLTQAARDRSSPVLRPRDAATLIVIDRSGRQPRILLGRRHPGHRFMPGKFVFPGGRVEAGDRRMLAYGALDARTEERLLARVTRPSAQRARALALAAIRETWEETGLMIGTSELGPPPIRMEGPWADFVAQGVFPELDSLAFVARAITPPGRPKRFDTRFFAVDADRIAHRVEGVVGEGSELVELAWVEPRKALELDIPVITGVVIEELLARLEGSLSVYLPVPFYSERRGRFVRVEL